MTSLSLAEAELVAGDPAKAIELVRYVLKALPDSGDAHWIMARCKQLSGDTAEAITSAKRAHLLFKHAHGQDSERVQAIESFLRKHEVLIEPSAMLGSR